MGEELRPCPFCASVPNVWLGPWRFDLTRVKMATCYGGNGKAHQPFSMPLATWRTRTDPGHIAAIRGTVEACANLCERLASEGDAYERDCAGERSWFNLKGDGQRAAATAIRAHLDTLLQTKGDDRG